MTPSLRFTATLPADGWEPLQQDVSAVIDRMERSGEALGFRHVWYLGPVGHVQFQAGSTAFTYSGSLLHLCQGLAAWSLAPVDTFIWPGESVWQTPDLAINVVPDGTASLELRFRRPKVLHAPAEDVRREVGRLLRVVATAYLHRSPQLALASDMSWLTSDPSATPDHMIERTDLIPGTQDAVLEWDRHDPMGNRHEQ